MTERYALRAAALELLKVLGPLSSYELAFKLDNSEPNVYRALRRAHAATPKEVHIKRYKRNEEPGMKKAHWIIIWAHGDGKDAKKPGKMSKAENSKRYYAKNKAIINIRAKMKWARSNNRINSPFAAVVFQQLRSKK